jgi:hypothetical protein
VLRIDRARRLDARALKADLGDHPNPTTGVAALVAHMFALGGTPPGRAE